MTTLQTSRSPAKQRGPRLVWLALIALSMIAVASLFASAGCSGGPACYRNTDCPVTFHCASGECVHVVVGEPAPDSIADAGQD